MQTITQIRSAIDAPLQALKFHPVDDGYQRRNLTLEVEPRWSTFSQIARDATDLLGEDGPSPGLWKLARHPSGHGLRREFHLPSELLSPVDAQYAHDRESGPIAAVVQWVSQTGQGRLPPGWQCPPRDELIEALPENGLTVESGPFVRQGTIDSNGRRLAVRFPIVPSLPANLPASRRAWLETTLADVQHRYRMVRVTRRVEGGRTSVEAEVDLSGAPSFLLPALLVLAVDAARTAVSWLVWSAGFLATPAVHCTVWDVSPERTWSAERR